MLRRRGCLGAAVALAMLPGIAMAQDGMVILAAASLKNALDEISADWSRATGKPAPGSTGRTEATELWTFRRPAGAGPDAWKLSAIQQAA